MTFLSAFFSTCCLHTVVFRSSCSCLDFGILCEAVCQEIIMIFGSVTFVAKDVRMICLSDSGPHLNTCGLTLGSESSSL